MSLTDLIPGISQAKLIVGAIGLAAIATPAIGWAITAHTLASRTASLKSVTEWQQTVRVATSTAASTVDAKGKPAVLALDQVALQISYLGGDVDKLKSALAAKTAESDARAKAFAASGADDKANNTSNDARAKADQGRTDTLNALAKNMPAQPGCTAPAALRASLEGL